MTTTFNTGNPIGSTKAKDLSDNASNFDDASLLLSDTWVDRLGVTRDTVNGRIKRMGFAVPVTYGAGILFTANDNIKTVDEGGIIYAPLPSALPFTTTNFATDASKFYTVQGTDQTRGFIASKTLSEAVSDVSAYIGKRVEISDRSNGLFEYISPIANDGFSKIEATGASLTLKLVIQGCIHNIAHYGAINGAADNTDAMQAAADAAGGSGGVYFEPVGLWIHGQIDMKSSTIMMGCGYESRDQRLSDVGNPVVTQVGYRFFNTEDNPAPFPPADNAANLTTYQIHFLGTVVTDGFEEFKHLFLCQGVTDLFIDRCWFTGWQGDAVVVRSGNFTAQAQNRNVVITNTVFDGINNNQRQAITITDVYGMTIRDNTIRNCTRDGDIAWVHPAPYDKFDQSKGPPQPGAIDIEPNTGFKDSTGDTDGSTGVITGMTSTAALGVGSVLFISAGFPDVTIKVVSVDSTTQITVDVNSDSVQSNVTVSSGDTFIILNDIYIGHNNCRNIGGNVAAIGMTMPTDSGHFDTHPPRNMTVEHNHMDGVNTGWRFSQVQSSFVTVALEPLNVIVQHNSVRNATDRPFWVFGIRGLTMQHNHYENCANAAAIGWLAVEENCDSIKSIHDTFRHCGQVDGNAIAIYTGSNIKILHPTFDNIGVSGGGFGVPITFADGVSSKIKIEDVDTINNEGLTTGAISFGSKTAGSFVVGISYKIATIGTTDFTLIGAASNTVGLTFVATGVGTGTGTATAHVLAGGNTAIRNDFAGFDASEFPADLTEFGETSFETDIVALGGGQGGAYQLNSAMNVVSGGAAFDSVKLPTATGNAREITISNTTAVSIQVYPFSGDNLGKGLNSPESLAAGNSRSYRTYDNNNWIKTNF